MIKGKDPKTKVKFFRAEANKQNLELVEYQRLKGWLKFELEGNKIKIFLKNGRYVNSLIKKLGVARYQKNE